MRKWSSGFPTRSDTNPPMQLQKMARSMKISASKRRRVVLYLCSKNNGADQLCSYCTADLCVCFRIGKNPVFS